MSDMIKTIEDLDTIRDRYNEQTQAYSHQALVCGGAGCVSSNCAAVLDAVRGEIRGLGMEADCAVRETGAWAPARWGP